MIRVPNAAKQLAELQNTMGQHYSERLKARQETIHSSTDPKNPKHMDYSADQIARHRGIGVRTEYRVRWYGYSADKDT